MNGERSCGRPVGEFKTRAADSRAEEIKRATEPRVQVHVCQIGADHGGVRDNIRIVDWAIAQVMNAALGLRSSAAEQQQRTECRLHANAAVAVAEEEERVHL